MNNSNKTPDFLSMAEKLKRDAVRKAEVKSIQFFQDTFRKKGFTDTSFEAWPKSNSLIGKRTLEVSGDLKRSIRKNDGLSNENRLVVESYKPYANYHNEGCYIVVTDKMKRYFWIKYAELAKVPKVNGRFLWSKARVKNSKTELCRRIALKKVGSKIKIPKRQFMGHSSHLMSELEKWFAGVIDSKFKDVISSSQL
jgi:hypothetical protein